MSNRPDEVIIAQLRKTADPLAHEASDRIAVLSSEYRRMVALNDALVAENARLSSGMESVVFLGARQAIVHTLDTLIEAAERTARSQDITFATGPVVMEAFAKLVREQKKALFADEEEEQASVQ